MDCLCAQTRHLARALTNVYEQHLQPAGVTPAQFELLATLAAVPGIPQLELSSLLHLDPTTLSRNVIPLRQRRWISVRPSPSDRRQVIYRLTAAGRRKLRQAMPLWQAAQAHMQRQLGSDWDRIQVALQTMQRAIPSA